MVAQPGAFSTTLLLIESQSPVVSNKTNLIDQVYKSPCTAGKDLLFRLYLFIYSLSFANLRERVPACGTRKLGLFHIKKRKDAEMQFKGFTIRSMASAINQRQGSSGVRRGLRVQNEPLKQQVESPLFSEQSRRVKTGVKLIFFFFFYRECRTEPTIFYKISFVLYFLGFKNIQAKKLKVIIKIFKYFEFMLKCATWLRWVKTSRNMRYESGKSVFASRVSPTMPTIPVRLQRYWAQCDTEVINQINIWSCRKAAGIA